MNLTPEQIEAMLNAQSGSGNSPGFDLTADEKDALGEVGNMSMGAAATTMYTILGRVVSITTPRVYVYPDLITMLEEYRVPYIVVEVNYTKGLLGRSLLLLKETDAAMITDIMMGGDGNVDLGGFELDEIHLSAISELANQMAGAGATSLAQIFGGPVDIAPPTATLVNLALDDIGLWRDESGAILKIAFDMEIEGLLNSELMQILPFDFGKDMINTLLSSQGEETAQMAAAPYDPDPAPPASLWEDIPPQLPSYPPISAPEPYAEAMSAYPAPGQYPAAEPYPVPGHPTSGYPAQSYAGLNAHPLDASAAQYPAAQRQAAASNSVHENLALIVGLPLQVTAELGRTSKTYQEVLDFNIGSVIVLEKLAGDMLEIQVNGKQIARGEAVTVEESFGVRITELFTAGRG